jgi:uncharacterized protein YodC (DUF2158 family)
MATKYSIGDQVQLKSGGPRMTISGGPYGEGDYYECDWFAGATNKSSRYPVGALMPWVEPKK